MADPPFNEEQSSPDFEVGTGRRHPSQPGRSLLSFMLPRTHASSLPLPRPLLFPPPRPWPLPATHLEHTISRAPHPAGHHILFLLQLEFRRAVLSIALTATAWCSLLDSLLTLVTVSYLPPLFTLSVSPLCILQVYGASLLGPKSWLDVGETSSGGRNVGE